jgi:hypothetical protein
MVLASPFGMTSWSKQQQGAKRKTVETKSVRRPGIEPGSTAWKATMLTITPATLLVVATGGKKNYVFEGQRRTEC